MSTNKKFHQNRQNRRPDYQGGSMRDSFDRIAAEGLVVRRGNGERSTYKPISSWKGDGIDHINIDFYAETELGKALDFSNKMPFRHHIFDQFNTLEGFWAYIRSEERDDRLRYKVGRELTLLIREQTQRHVKHMKAIIADTMFHRINGNAKLKRMMYENELPFDMYRYNPQGVAIRRNNHEWIVEAYMEIQAAIQSNREPNFYFLCDPGETPTDIYESVRPVIPESVRQRLAARHNRREDFNARPQQPKEKHHKQKLEKQQKPENTNKQKGVRDDHTFNKENGYCLVVPTITPETESVFLKQFRKIIKINETQIETGPLVAEVDLPIKALSDNSALESEGLISQYDVVRAAPANDLTFRSDFKSQNVIQLDTFVVGQVGDESSISIPLWLKLVERSFEKDGDVQLVERDGNTLKITRNVELYKKIGTVVSSKGLEEVPEIISEALSDLNNLDVPQPNLEKFTYAILSLAFTLTITDDEGGEKLISIRGTVSPKGASTGPHDDADREIVWLSSEGTLYPILGYTFTMFRGRLKQANVEKPIEKVPVSGNDESVLTGEGELHDEMSSGEVVIESGYLEA